jgi:hypothetical protein
MRLRLSLGTVLLIPHQVEPLSYSQALYAPEVHPHANQLNRL